MNRFRRNHNRTRNMDRETVPASPNRQADPGTTRCSTSTVESWTTHDSNLALFECLSTATPARPALPTELILQILSHPTRWLRLHSISHPPSADPDKPIVIIRERPTGKDLLYTRPFSAQEIGRVRKVIFTFRSRDQGWSSRPDQGSWSWFEASLALPSANEDGRDQDKGSAESTGSSRYVGDGMERHDKRLENQPRYKIKTNMHASTEPKEYRVELTDSHELVQRVREGDRIVLWACACFPGWENRVYEAKISVLGIDDLTMGTEEDSQWGIMMGI